MKILRTRRLDQLLRKLDPALRRDAIATLRTFSIDSSTRALNFEKLRGFRALYSIRINRNFRIVLRRTEVSDTYEPIEIGPHDVYRHLRNGDD